MCCLKNNKMDKKKRNIYAFLVVAILVIGLFAYSSLNKPGNHDEFAKCLTEEGAKFYGAFWCPHCAEQKKLFGNSIDYVNYIECSTPDQKSQTQICIDENIIGYPTWEFLDGSRLSGVQPLEILGSKTGCVLE